MDSAPLKKMLPPTNTDAQMCIAALDRAVALNGNVYRFAERLGLTYQAVQKWRKSGRIPAERALHVERITGRRVRRSELRPDLWPPRHKPTSGSAQPNDDALTD